MYQNIYYDNNTRLLHIWDDKYGYIQKPYKKYAYVKSNDGNFLSIYGDKLKKITSGFDNYEGDLFEGDISPEVRYLIDNYTEDDGVSKQNIMFIDIETESINEFPNINTAKNKITSVSVWIQSENKFYAMTLDPKHKIQEIVNAELEVSGFSTELELLDSVIELIANSKITILSGWHSEGFDLPYLTKRIEVLFGKDRVCDLSPIGIASISNYDGQWRFAGFSHLDYLKLYKKFTYSEKNSYTLDNIANIELGRKKLKFDGTLDELYETDINKFIKYNLNDVMLLVELENKMKFIEVALAICHIGHIPYEGIYSQSRIVDSAVLTYMKRKEIVAPNAHPSNKEGEFKGAYVKTPQVGLHRYVYDLDFSSLYPSAIITLNISPETKITKIDDWDILADDNTKFNVNNDVVSKKQLKEFCYKNDCCISANGVMYNLKNEGILPKVLKMWIEERKEKRALQKKYGIEKNIEEEKRYNISQTALKILANSLYGIMGLSSWRFYDLDNAEAVTTTGQAAIKYAEKIINEYYSAETGNTKDYVIYIDTDSIFASSLPLMECQFKDVWKTNPVKYSKIVCSIVQEECNKKIRFMCSDLIFINIDRYKHSFEMKQELIARSGLFIAKKRYGLLVIDKNGVSVNNELVVKGIDIVRSSYAKVFQDFLSFILTEILEENKKESIDKAIVEFKKLVKTEFSIQDIATPTGVKGIKKYQLSGNRYKKGTPVHVKASINYNAWLDKNNLNKKYEKIIDNSKIRWIYTIDRKAGITEMAFLNDNVPKELLNFLKDKINYNRLFSSTTDSKIRMLYESIGWIFEESKNNISKFLEVD